jgi:multiple sugar transport system substrate-binding protein
LLFGSSGDSETAAINAAAAAWGKQSGNTVTATPAKDLTQQLTQAMAGGSPPDLFYVDASKFAALQKSGALASYGDQLANKNDFYPPCGSRSAPGTSCIARRRTSPPWVSKSTPTSGQRPD